MEAHRFESEVKKLRDFSVRLKLSSKDNGELVNQLNSLSDASRTSLFNTYQHADGPITGIRKDIARVLKDGDIGLEELTSIIENAKEGNEQSFDRMYKGWFNILYMFLIADFRHEMNEAINYISRYTIQELNAATFLEAKKFDFTGERETGSTRCWIAFVNKTHQSQQTAKQLFLMIDNGQIEYCFYDRPTDKKIDKTLLDKDTHFDYEHYLNAFRNHLTEIEQDIWEKKLRYWRVGTKDDHSSYWQEMEAENKICIGWSEIGDLRSARVRNKKAVAELLVGEGYFVDDKRTRSRKAGEIFNFYSVLSEGDIVLAQDGDTILGIGMVNSTYTYNPDASFAHQRGVQWLVKNPGFSNDIGRRTSLYQIKDESRINEIKHALQFTQQSTSAISTPIFNSPLLRQQPLNQILFGPPGTGKTYHTINKAISIIDGIKETDLDQYYEERKDLKRRFDELMIDDWESPNGQIGFITFHQSMTYEDFIEGIKPELNDNQNVIYDIVPGIFKLISSIARDNWLDANKGNKEQFSFEESFSKLKDDWQENQDMKFPLKKEGNDYTILGFTKSSIKFKKASGGTGHTLSISTLRDYFYNRREVRNAGVGIYYPSLLNKLKSYQPSLIVEKEEKKYVLIIDEINRGNVSQIFGELITLIENDKRLGKDEAIEVTLPYSKDKFGVPPNLHIIGTMNTADRSVEALDTALRRRFEFEEIPPKYDLDQLQYEFESFTASSILKAINTRIEKLTNKDHAIGHSYFFLKEGEAPEEKLPTVFYKNIIPLLQEYFYGDFSKIGLVLGKGFVRKKNWSVVDAAFADFDSESATDFNDREIFEIVDYTKSLSYSVKIGSADIDLDFIKAIRLLMRQPIA